MSDSDTRMSASESDAEMSASVSANPANISSNGSPVAPGLTHTEMVAVAALTINEESGGNGADIDEIFEFIKERTEITPEFRNTIEEKVEALVSGNKLEKVGNRYKIVFDDATTSEAATNATRTMSPEDSSSKPQPMSSGDSCKPQTPSSGDSSKAQDSSEAQTPSSGDPSKAQDSSEPRTLSSEEISKPQDVPSTSLASEDMLERIEAKLKLVAIAESVDFEAKVACAESDRSNQLLEESNAILQLAKELHDLCAKGEKVFLR